MSRARIGLRVGSSVALVGCVLLLACGRTSIEGCAWDDCADASAIGGHAAGGKPSTSGGAGAGVSAGAGGKGGTIGGAFSGTGGVVSAGQPSVAGAAGAESDAPFVLLLLDGSTSMYDRQVWQPTYEALTGAGGPLERYQARVRFGFSSYRGRGQTAEDDPACAVMTSVDFALSNNRAIRDVYGGLSTVARFPPWETPTGHALTRATAALLAEPDSVAKYVLLISDGAPDTCSTTNPQCGQDRAVFAVQQAFLRGVQTRAIGVGFGNEYPGCTPDTARCAADHFQDIANAGRGLPVISPPAGYTALPCIAETDGQLLGTYADRGGSAPFTWAMSPAEVAAAVTQVLQEIAP